MAALRFSNNSMVVNNCVKVTLIPIKILRRSSPYRVVGCNYVEVEVEVQESNCTCIRWQHLNLPNSK